MAAPSLPSLVPPQSPAIPFVRVEYLGFETVGEHREFRLRVYGPDASREFHFRIAIASFTDGGIRMQDGPDVCYQKLLQVAAGDTTSADVVTIDGADLASYREAHTKVAKHRRSWTPPSTLATPVPAPAVVRRQRPTAALLLPLAVPPVAESPAFEEGQRVSHAVYGAGVTTSSNGAHTVVTFDKQGPKMFITSMLKVTVLSAAHAWETGARGKNRPCPAPPSS
jgi:hypothetical protein